MKRTLLVLGALLLVACADPLAVAAPTPPPRSTLPTAAPLLLPPGPVGAAGGAASADEPPPTALPVPSATPGQRPLLLWAAAEGPELELLQQLAREWRLRSGRELLVVGKSPDALRTELLVGALRGESPGLIWGSEGELATLYSAGQIQPLGDLATPPLLAGPEQAALQGGQRWAVPIAARGGLVLLYNRRLLPTPPATTDELIAAARQQTADGRFGLVYNWPQARWLLPWLSGFGGSTTGDDGVTPQLAGPALDQALALLQELRSSGPPPPASYEQGAALFADGKAAMAIDGDWSLPGYEAAAVGADLGVAPLPVVSASGRPAASALGAFYLMAHRSLPAADIAATRDLVAALLAPDTQRRFAALHLLPVLPVALDDPLVQGDPLLAALARGASAAPALPFTAAQRCTWQTIDAALPLLLLGQRDRTATLQVLQQGAAQCVASR